MILDHIKKYDKLATPFLFFFLNVYIKWNSPIYLDLFENNVLVRMWEQALPIFTYCNSSLAIFCTPKQLFLYSLFVIWYFSVLLHLFFDLNGFFLIKWLWLKITENQITGLYCNSSPNVSSIWCPNLAVNMFKTFASKVSLGIWHVRCIWVNAMSNHRGKWGHLHFASISAEPYTNMSWHSNLWSWTCLFVLDWLRSEQ